MPDDNDKKNDKEEDQPKKDDNSNEDAKENDDNDEGDKDGSNHQIKQLRKESAKKRIEIKKLRDKLESAEAKIASAGDDSDKDAKGDKEDSKKAKKETDIIGVVNKRYIRAELKAEALKAGLVDVDALKMFDTSSIEIDDNGDVIGVSELVEEMRMSKPYAFSTTAKDTTTDKKTPDSSKVDSKSALDMSDDEFAKTGEKLGLRVNSWS